MGIELCLGIKFCADVKFCLDIEFCLSIEFGWASSFVQIDHEYCVYDFCGVDITVDIEFCENTNKFRVEIELGLQVQFCGGVQVYMDVKFFCGYNKLWACNKRVTLTFFS